MHALCECPPIFDRSNSNGNCHKKRKYYSFARLIKMELQRCEKWNVHVYRIFSLTLSFNTVQCSIQSKETKRTRDKANERERAREGSIYTRAEIFSSIVCNLLAMLAVYFSCFALLLIHPSINVDLWLLFLCSSFFNHIFICATPLLHTHTHTQCLSFVFVPLLFCVVLVWANCILWLFFLLLLWSIDTSRALFSACMYANLCLCKHSCVQWSEKPTTLPKIHSFFWFDIHFHSHGFGILCDSFK